MRIVLALVVSGALSVCAYAYYPLALIATLPVFACSLWLGLKEHEKDRNAYFEKVDEAQTKLKNELLAAHRRLLTSAELVDAIKTEVLTLLIDAARHLDELEGSSRLYYEDDSCLNNKLQGLALVERARTLIKENSEESIDNTTAGVLYLAVEQKNEKAIHNALIGKSEAFGFVCFHAEERLRSIDGWFQQFVDNCKAMGFELRFKTLKNTDRTAAASEQYKTIAYISY